MGDLSTFFDLDEVRQVYGTERNLMFLLMMKYCHPDNNQHVHIFDPNEVKHAYDTRRNIDLQ
jgi:hypothetical protein